MPFKASRGVLAAIAAAIVGVLIAISLMAGGGRHGGKPPPVVLGPDTASAIPHIAPNPANPANALVEAQKVEFEDETLKFHAELPAGAAGDPVLKHLNDESEHTLAQLKSKARADYAHAKRQLDVKIVWAYTAKAADYVSLVGEESEFARDAHPNSLYDSYIAHAPDNRQIKAADLFAVPLSAKLINGICDALHDQKLDRLHAATIFDDPIKCTGDNANAKTDAAVLALAPSDQPNKFGGLYAYYSPYIVGSHAEGAYKLTIQQSVFADDLKPEFKALFAGHAPELKN